MSGIILGGLSALLHLAALFTAAVFGRSLTNDLGAVGAHTSAGLFWLALILALGGFALAVCA